MRDHILSIWPTDGLQEILDLGCRDCWHTSGLPGVRRHVGVDLWPEALARGTKKAQEGRVPGWEPVLQDALAYCINSEENAFDAVLAIDLLEHLDPIVARDLLEEMKRITRRLAIVWTTMGFIAQAAYDVDGNPNPYEIHRWGPEPTDLWAARYHVRVLPNHHEGRGGAIFAWHDKRGLIK